MKKKIRVFGRRLRGKKLAVKLEGSWRITEVDFRKIKNYRYLMPNVYLSVFFEKLFIQTP